MKTHFHCFANYKCALMKERACQTILQKCVHRMHDRMHVCRLWHVQSAHSGDQPGLGLGLGLGPECLLGQLSPSKRKRWSSSSEASTMRDPMNARLLFVAGAGRAGRSQEGARGQEAPKGRNQRGGLKGKESQHSYAITDSPLGDRLTRQPPSRRLEPSQS